MKNNIEQKIRDFIRDNFLMGEDNGNLSSNDSLLEKGIIDSVGILELVSFLEETFDIKVQDEELVPENLDSIAFIVNYIQHKKPELRG